MKKKAILTGAAILLLSFALSLPAFAEKSAAKPTLAKTVSLNYLIGTSKLSGDMMGGVTMTSKPKFLPDLKADIGVTPQINAVLEYASSNKSRVSYSDGSVSDGTAENSILRIGANYNFGGAYAGIALNQYKLKFRSDVPGGDGALKTSGLGLNVGYKMIVPKSPFSGAINIGFGISNKAKDDSGDSSKATPIDLDLCASYKFGTGLKANLGYRDVNIKVKESAGVNGMASGKDRINGFYLGVGYDF